MKVFQSDMGFYHLAMAGALINLGLTILSVAIWG